jgi:hypothetical protein
MFANESNGFKTSQSTINNPRGVADLGKAWDSERQIDEGWPGVMALMIRRSRYAVVASTIAQRKCLDFCFGSSAHAGTGFCVDSCYFQVLESIIPPFSHLISIRVSLES